MHEAHENRGRESASFVYNFGVYGLQFDVYTKCAFVLIKYVNFAVVFSYVKYYETLLWFMIHDTFKQISWYRLIKTIPFNLFIIISMSPMWSRLIKT